MQPQPEPEIKALSGASRAQYAPEPGEPAPQQDEVAGVGLYIFQHHGGGKKRCGSFNTVAVSTKTEMRGTSKIITRYRKCLTCGKRYSHTTILKKLGEGMWTETGTGFSSE